MKNGLCLVLISLMLWVSGCATTTTRMTRSCVTTSPVGGSGIETVCEDRAVTVEEEKPSTFWQTVGGIALIIGTLGLAVLAIDAATRPVYYPAPVIVPPILCRSHHYGYTTSTYCY